MASTSFISSARLAPFAHTATFAILLGALATSTAVFAAEGDHFIVGLGAANLPRYKGADERETKPVPLIDVQKGRFFARTDAGIGLNVYQNAYVTQQIEQAHGAAPTASGRAPGLQVRLRFT
jgi:outer membrane scaffolding protein for murein synthesis (MipA/OmpV family)